MTNPTIDSEYTNVTHGAVVIGRHVAIASGVLILPGVTLGEGCSVGAMSFVKRDCEPFGIYFGLPARKIGTRKKRLLDMEKKMLSRI